MRILMLFMLFSCFHLNAQIYHSGSKNISIAYNCSGQNEKSIFYNADSIQKRRKNFEYYIQRKFAKESDVMNSFSTLFKSINKLDNKTVFISILRVLNDYYPKVEKFDFNLIEFLKYLNIEMSRHTF
jgi:hypothetical protein